MNQSRDKCSFDPHVEKITTGIADFETGWAGTQTATAGRKHIMAAVLHCNELRRYPSSLQGAEHFLGLSQQNAVVRIAVENEERRITS